MTINSTSQISDVERVVPTAKQPHTPPDLKPKAKEAAPAAAEASVEPRKGDTEPLKEVLAQSDISLNFRTDEETGRVVVEMIDNATGDPVMQIPNEVSLRLTEMFSKVQGQLFEARI